MSIRKVMPVVATALLVTFTSLPMLAAPDILAAPALVPTATPPAEAAIDSVTVKGILEYRDLEGGFYTVGSWALAGDARWLDNYVGKQVVVRGKPVQTVSTRMVQELQVIELTLQEPAADPDTPVSIIAVPISAPAPQEKRTVEGTVEYRDLEGGFYSVDGWGLIGDEAQFRALVGQRVVIQGREFTGISTRMVKQIEVNAVAVMLSANRPQPSGVTVGGKKVSFDQSPVVVEGTLMVPLRAVVEAAGGSVEWLPEERAVSVKLPDRTAYFAIGQAEAELNENGVYYFRRNLLPMARAAAIVGSRTLIPADAVTRILGLVEQADSDNVMNLVPGR